MLVGEKEKRGEHYPSWRRRAASPHRTTPDASPNQEVARDGGGEGEHLAPRRADYEQAFTGVNLKTDIISGALFNISGALFRAPETIKISGALFRQFGPIY